MGEDYQQRVIDEKKELDDKLKKLKRMRSFLKSATFLLTEAQLELLKRQEKVMTEYSEILAKRIELF
jgi:hypothetical protein